jgi:diacylglycerol kinase
MSSFLRSFIYAGRGIWIMIQKERNFKIHLLAFLLVLGAGIYFQITKVEWLIISLTSAFVLSLETVNSAIERLCDLYSSDQNEKIKNIKDISAGAVLIAAGFAVVVGLLIFAPYMIK